MSDVTNPSTDSETGSGSDTKTRDNWFTTVLRLVQRVFRRWTEEPIGIFYGLLVFFALRVPEQISDMMANVTWYDDTGWKWPDAPAFVGFAVAGLTLANAVWFWMTAVNRTEICIKGGGLDEIDFLEGAKPVDVNVEGGKSYAYYEVDAEVAREELETENYNYPVWPYRLASSAAASIIVMAIAFALSGPLVGELLPNLGAASNLLEVLILFTLSMGIGWWLAAYTADGGWSDSQDAELKFRLRLFHLTWLHQQRRRCESFPIVGLPRNSFRTLSIFLYARVLGRDWPVFLGALGLSTVIFWFLILIDDNTPYLLNALALLVVIPFLTFANLYCLANIWAGCQWLRQARQIKAADANDFLKQAHELSMTSERKTCRNTLRISFTVAFLVSFSVMSLLGSESADLSQLATSPTVILLSMAGSVAPLVLALTILRDVLERFVSVMISGSLGGGYLSKRSRGNHANAARVLGRAAALLTFVVLLLAPPSALNVVTGTHDHLYALESHVTQPDGDESATEVDRTELLEASAKRVTQRQDTKTALEAWHKARFGEAESPEEEVPVLIIAAAGGASRSAAWFLTLMHELQRTGYGPQISQHTFAISAVSGGALGTVTYAMHEACSAAPLPTEHVAAIGSADLLTASASRFFAVDLVRRLPFWGYVVSWANERNQVLQTTFEHHWTSVWKMDKALIQKGFLEMREGCDARPGWYQTHLLLNGVDVQSGRRIVTSSLDLSRDPAFYPNVIDFFADFEHDISLSGAVMNSARFPLISPAGIYESERSRGEPINRQIIDGGYFENNGVETALDLIEDIKSIEGLSFTPRPALLLVSNDASHAPRAPKCGVDALTSQEEAHSFFHTATLTCEPEGLPRATRLTQRDEVDASRVPELLAPIRGLFAIRDSHSKEALLDARETLCAGPEPDSKDAFFHVGLPRPVCEGARAPMNWVLHEDVAEFFMTNAIQDPHVQWEIEKLISFLKD